MRALIEVPRLMAEALALEPQIEQLARDLAKCRDVLYLGRGTSYPLALEGALKLKEISYIHAEGYAAGELKHGPIALIDENDAGDRDRAATTACSRRPSPTCRRSRRAAARSSSITDPKGAREAHVRVAGQARRCRRCPPQ